MTTRSRQHRFSRSSSEGRKYSRSDSEKRKRLRLIPPWLEKNADFMNHPQPPNSIYDQEAFQELIESVTEGNTVAVKLLAEAGVNVNMQDCDGWTPLHHAVAKGQDEVAEMLIKKGALKTRRNNDGFTPYEQKEKNSSEKLEDNVFEEEIARQRSSRLNSRVNLHKRSEDELELPVSRQRSSHLSARANFHKRSEEELELPFSRQRSSHAPITRAAFGKSDVFEDELPILRQPRSQLNTQSHFKRSVAFETEFPVSRPRSPQSTRFNRGTDFGSSHVFDEFPDSYNRSSQHMSRRVDYRSPDGMNYGTSSSSFSSYQISSPRKY